MKKMKEKIEEWANRYIKETEKLIDILKYHNVMQDEVNRAEGRVQAYIEMKKFLSSLDDSLLEIK